MLSAVQRNIVAVQSQITAAWNCTDPSLRFGSIPRLVAVSKRKPVVDICAAYAAGQRHFGENYVQELIEKANDEQLLVACPDIRWHFIGHLQLNKVRKLIENVPNLHVVETVDSVKLAETLNRVARGRVDQTLLGKINVMLQVNTSGEIQKHGCEPEQVLQLARMVVQDCPFLQLIGLMTIGTASSCAEVARGEFSKLFQIRNQICTDLDWEVGQLELSMGMSNDFQEAICCGSSSVRVDMEYNSIPYSKLCKEVENSEQNLEQSNPVATELRISMKMNCVESFRGSAYIEMNKTKILCTVVGPREAHKSSEDSMGMLLANCGKLTVSVRFAPFAKTPRLQRRRKEVALSEEQNLATLIQQAFDSVVLVERYPKAEIVLIISILQDSGNVLCASLNCCTMALVSAGIEIYDLLTSASETLEDKGDNGTLTIGYMAKLHQHALTEFTGTASPQTIRKMMTRLEIRCTEWRTWMEKKIRAQTQQ
ncbi:Proline synthase co-transcribed bacterial -like protein [Trichinella britovi]|uniref:Pyridoxal phosphate homeostasis protein n=2 Tax=Trichinella TaxID=6333 RepID=A0A0V1DIC2_TRIBR|nr:Proline synthase co-transcribed bacterial -like protein [Trichinella murrelli]KRY61094.1 Proline synthase co-transcribed bacterial -like protein [Trichinella britovi]